MPILRGERHEVVIERWPADVDTHRTCLGCVGWRRVYRKLTGVEAPPGALVEDWYDAGAGLAYPGGDVSEDVWVVRPPPTRVAITERCPICEGALHVTTRKIQGCDAECGGCGRCDAWSWLAYEGDRIGCDQCGQIAVVVSDGDHAVVSYDEDDPAFIAAWEAHRGRRVA